MFTQALYDTLREQGRNRAAIARMIDLTPVEFYQKMTGYHGRRFSGLEREALGALLGVKVSSLFPDTEDERVSA